MNETNIEKPKNAYLKEGRIIDVIRLIKILSIIDKFSFRSELGLNKDFRDSPRSANSWLEIAIQHPEFFRVNNETDSIILLIRFVKEKRNEEDRKGLKIEETQKLIDWAVELQEKQILWHQRNNFMSRIHSALIGAFVAIGLGLLSLFWTNKKINDAIEKFNIEIQESNKLNLKKFESIIAPVNNNLDTVNGKIETIQRSIKEIKKEN